MLPRMNRFTQSFLLAIILVVLAYPLAAQTPTTAARLKEIDEYSAKAGVDWKVPGFAIAIVKDDRVVFAKGYGVLELGKPTAVDENTLFAIASNSKAFTAAALAILVDEGKVKWDDKVTKYLPSFELYDPYVTRELTIRDLLSHRSGLATFGGDLLWYESEYSRDEILRRIRFLKPTSSFRSRFGYQNIMFLAAGEVVAKVSGKSWDEFVKERFFAPLAMKRTVTSHADLLNSSNVAMPHNEVDGKIRAIRYGKVDNIGAAGGIKSSVADMAQWLRLQLGRGTYEGRKLFSSTASREMWTPHTVFSGISEQAEKFNPTRHFNLYGLGWISERLPWPVACLSRWRARRHDFSGCVDAGRETRCRRTHEQRDSALNDSGKQGGRHVFWACLPATGMQNFSRALKTTRQRERMRTEDGNYRACHKPNCRFRCPRTPALTQARCLATPR